MGIPLICLVDDFSALMPRLLASKAMAAFSRFCETVGITLKAGKSEVGTRVAFLGIQGWFPTAGNRYALHIPLPGGKRKARAALLADYIARRSISHQELAKLIDRLSFSQTLLFGEFARTQLRPLYQKLRRGVYNARLSVAETAVCGWWERVARSFSPRTCALRQHFYDLIVYTDAVPSPPSIVCITFQWWDWEITAGTTAVLVGTDSLAVSL